MITIYTSNLEWPPRRLWLTPRIIIWNFGRDDVDESGVRHITFTVLFTAGIARWSWSITEYTRAHSTCRNCQLPSRIYRINNINMLWQTWWSIIFSNSRLLHYLVCNRDRFFHYRPYSPKWCLLYYMITCFNNHQNW